MLRFFVLTYGRGMVTMGVRGGMLMLAYVSHNILWLILVSILLLSILAILAGIAILIVNIVKAKHDKDYAKLKYNLLSIACILIVAVSWMTNLGWVRIITIIIPPIHAMLLFFIVNGTASQSRFSPRLRWYIRLSCITYLLANILLPDGGDIGPMYVFFGLIRNNSIASLCSPVSELAFAANIVFLILQLVESRKIKKRRKQEAEDSREQIVN